MNLVPVFIVGLLGSVHCIGMCGGIVSALSAADGPRKPFPVPVRTVTASVIDSKKILAYNAGRIASYATAGALAGGLVEGVRWFSVLTQVQVLSYWLVNLMLVALGLSLMNVWHGLAQVEVLGQGLWRRLQKPARRLLPMDTPLKALALGGIWGWLPCGMVYSVLVTAMFSGSAISGAAVMLAFGLGTLPTLLLMGMFGMRVRQWTANRHVRLAAGLVMLTFGLLGMARAVNGAPSAWLDAFCITPLHASAPQWPDPERP